MVCQSQETSQGEFAVVIGALPVRRSHHVAAALVCSDSLSLAPPPGCSNMAGSRRSNGEGW